MLCRYLSLLITSGSVFLKFQNQRHAASGFWKREKKKKVRIKELVIFMKGPTKNCGFSSWFFHCFSFL